MSIFKKKTDNTVIQNNEHVYTASVIKENVKEAGGKVDGILRFSIQWNDIESDLNDLDAHCVELFKGSHISFKNKLSNKTSGNLDVDIIHPKEGKVAVENITYPDKSKLIAGEYLFYVQCYYSRMGKSGFRAEIECGGKIYQYHYAAEMKQTQNIKVACVYYTGKKFKIKHFIKPVKIIKY